MAGLEITKDKFMSYEKVKLSGVTNMLMVSQVMSLSGLTKEECFFIMKNYSKLAEQYL